jgi:hypothetical protein
LREIFPCKLNMRVMQKFVLVNFTAKKRTLLYIDTYADIVSYKKRFCYPIGESFCKMVLIRI